MYPLSFNMVHSFEKTVTVACALIKVISTLPNCQIAKLPDCQIANERASAKKCEQPRQCDWMLKCHSGKTRLHPKTFFSLSLSLCLGQTRTGVLIQNRPKLQQDPFFPGGHQPPAAAASFHISQLVAAAAAADNRSLNYFSSPDCFYN